MAVLTLSVEIHIEVGGHPGSDTPRRHIRFAPTWPAPVVCATSGKGFEPMHGRALRGLGVLLLLLVAASVPAAGQVVDAALCDADGGRSGQLAKAQKGVLDLLGHETAADLTTLENESELAALAAKGYGFYDRQQTSVRGMGWAVFDTAYESPPGPGRPTLLLYAPSGDNVTEARDGFDFPYRLAGWAYAFPYSPGKEPTLLSCIEEAEWFVHEAGVHTYKDGHFVPVRPADDEPRGFAPGENPCPAFACPAPWEPGDYGHGRLWDLHLWRGDDGVPSVSMTNPGPKIPGVDPQIGKAFFYPEYRK